MLFRVSLAPEGKWLRGFKAGELDEKEYTRLYNKKILENLDPHKVWADLVSINGSDATILCYEKAGEFCHRQLVSFWFYTELGKSVPEFDYTPISEYKGFFK